MCRSSQPPSSRSRLEGNQFLVGNALKGRNLFCRTAACRHVRFLVPREHGGRTVDALDLQQPASQRFKCLEGFQDRLLSPRAMIES